jgi:hypothetical protein
MEVVESGAVHILSDLDVDDIALIELGLHGIASHP